MKEKYQYNDDKANNQEQDISNVQNDKVTIMERNNETHNKTYKSFCRILLRTISICLSSFYFGYMLAYLGGFQFSTIADLYHIENQRDKIQGFLQGIIPIGAGIGALFSSIVIRAFSRRNSILVVNVLAFISGILVLFPNLYLFFAVRLIQGMCVGLYSAIVPLLLKQYSPKQLSGTLGALNQTNIASGIFFVYLFQLILKNISNQKDHWRLIYGFPLITITLQTISLLFFFKQQTPKYYLLNNQQSECIECLRSIYEPQYVEQILQQKKSDMESNNPKTIDKNDKLSQMQQQVQSNSDRAAKGRKMRIFAALNLSVLQQFVGINIVVTYGLQIAQRAMPSLANIIPVFLNFQSVAASFVAVILLSRVGRKTILQAGTLICALSITLVAVGFLIQNKNQTAGNALVITGLVIFMANFGLSLGPVVWLYIAEIVQPQILPYTTLVNWAIASIVIITFPILTTAFGTPVPLYFFFAVWSSLGLAINSKLLIQTKGKSQKQIRQQYDDK